MKNPVKSYFSLVVSSEGDNITLIRVNHSKYLNILPGFTPIQSNITPSVSSVNYQIQNHSRNSTNFPR